MRVQVAVPYQQEEQQGDECGGRGGKFFEKSPWVVLGACVGPAYTARRRVGASSTRVDDA